MTLNLAILADYINKIKIFKYFSKRVMIPVFFHQL